MNEVVIQSHYDAETLAAMQLPGLPTTRPAIFKRAKAEGWNFIEVPGKGGRGGLRREYQPPTAVMDVIKGRLIDGMLNASSPAPAAATPALENLLPVSSQLTIVAPIAKPGALKDWQARVAEARMALLREVDRIAQVVGREKAITKVVIMAEDGTLPAHLAQLVPVANAKSGGSGKRTLSRRTLYNWQAEARQSVVDGRVQVNALAPKSMQALTVVPPWAGDLLAAYQRPQKPSLAWAVEQIAPKYGIEETALYHRARRFLQSMGNVEQQAGRMGSRDIKNIKPFIRRDSSVLWPADVYTADGHKFDAEVAHPAHGRPFRPEVTGIVDIGSRKYVGWSVDLAESGLAVLDALHAACQTGGIPSLLYVDNGSGYHNALMTAPGVGMESRLGFTMTHSIAYNSQSRGIIERSHQSVWVRAAKELPTYIGATMDKQAMQKVHKLTRRDVKLAGQSKLLMSFRDFIGFCEFQIDRYNNRPHRSLKKIFDPALGKKRHMTPNEAWEEGVREGAELVTITPDESVELFRPMKEVKVQRGEVNLFGNCYFAMELKEYNGDIVRAAYDVRNADAIWVYDQQGRYICAANFEANKRDYFAQTVLEQAATKRAKTRLGRIDIKREEIELELQGTPLREVAALEHNPSPVLRMVGDFDEPLHVHDVVELQLTESSEATIRRSSARPLFHVESERYEWLMQNRDGWTDVDKQFLAQFVTSDIYESLSERFNGLGLAWTVDNLPLLHVAS